MNKYLPRWYYVLMVLMMGVSAGGAQADEDIRFGNFTVTDIHGQELPLSYFDGQVVLLVNTASFCGFRRQFEGLERLWRKYRNQGLVVLGVPSNDFGGQEPGTEEQIRDFCETSYDVTFPMTAKMRVKGDDAHPLYLWLRDTMGEEARPRWNFHKYLIDSRGLPAASFPSSMDPEDPALIGTLTSVLAWRNTRDEQEAPVLATPLPATPVVRAPNGPLSGGNVVKSAITDR